MNKDALIAIIDFGSQTTMLIARRIREFGVMAKIFPPTIKKEQLSEASALILSGGPSSLLKEDALRIDESIFDLGLPTLGICYGMQLLVEHFGGSVKKAHIREFGKRQIDLRKDCELFHQVKNSIDVWMSHSDQVDLGNRSEFVTTASSESCTHAAIAWSKKQIFGVQFHPEVAHSECGDKILHNFVFRIAKAKKNFVFDDFVAQKIQLIKEQVGDARVIMALSGGVDSAVAAVLIHKAIKNQLQCVYVNHGLHREGEIDEIISRFHQELKMDLHVVDAKEQFFAQLAGITDPEEKRKRIGHTFIDIFEQESLRFENIAFLGQGTTYPDVIESECKNSGPSDAIKSHHNVGGLPERMKFKLIEPLRDLFKDEVIAVGRLLGLSDALLLRQPFPGPGLAVRIPGEVTMAKVDLLRKADAIVRFEMEQAKNTFTLPKNLWQWFAVLLPIRSVGVMGDARTYGETIVIRVVESTDGMTADWGKLPHEVLQIISTRITNEVFGISRVLYDVTQKPPGTIEWE